MEKIKTTKHLEYSLGLAVITAIGLPFCSFATTTPTLLLVNVIAIISILWSAFSVIRHADVLAHRLGEPYGSLILSLAVVILEVSLISILMLTGNAGKMLMRDTMLSILMIIMGGLIGISLLLGGRKFANQSFNLVSVRQYLIALIPLVVITMILPMAFPEGKFTKSQLLVVALICMMMYGVFLHLQTRTHQKLFIYADEDESEDHKGMPSPFSSRWHGVWLVVHLVAVIAVTKLNSVYLDNLLDNLNAPIALTGFLIALLTLSPEGLGAIKAVLNNQVQRAMNLYFGSALATISLTVPTVIIIALLTEQELVFGLDVPDAVLLIGMLLLSMVSFAGGKTNAMNGMSHIAMFIGFLLILFY
jgi:Ca2+/H+ antiporter